MCRKTVRCASSLAATGPHRAPSRPPRRSTTCPNRKSRATFSGHALMPIEILAVTKAFVFVMPMFSAGDVQKRPEAALLRIVKTIVERLCCVGEFF